MGALTELMSAEFNFFIENGGADLLSSLLSQLSSIGSVVVTILISVALFTIARRRGIRHPWLAWIPGGNMWILGAISDDYWLVTRRTVKNRRKWLLGLYIAVEVAAVAVAVFAILFAVLSLIIGFGGTSLRAGWLPVCIVLALLVLSGMAFIVLAVWLTVVQCMALYDIYRSCDSGHAELFLVLSILFGVCQLIFLMICKNKDDFTYTRCKVATQAPTAELPEDPTEV